MFVSDAASLSKTISYIAADYRASTVSFFAEPDKLDLRWNSLQAEIMAASIVSTAPRDTLTDTFRRFDVFTAYIGFYKCNMKLYSKSGDRLQVSFTYTIDNANFAVNRVSNAPDIQASTGSEYSTFMLAALPTSSPGLYTLMPKKVSGDTQLVYMSLPLVRIVVSTDLC